MTLWDELWAFMRWSNFLIFYTLGFEANFSLFSHFYHLLPRVTSISSMIWILANNNILRTFLWSGTCECDKTCKHNLHKITKSLFTSKLSHKSLQVSFFNFFFFRSDRIKAIDNYEMRLASVALFIFKCTLSTFQILVFNCNFAG